MNALYIHSTDNLHVKMKMNLCNNILHTIVNMITSSDFRGPLKTAFTNEKGHSIQHLMHQNHSINSIKNSFT